MFKVRLQFLFQVLDREIRLPQLLLICVIVNLHVPHPTLVACHLSLIILHFFLHRIILLLDNSDFTLVLPLPLSHFPLTPLDLPLESLVLGLSCLTQLPKSVTLGLHLTLPLPVVF